MFVRNWRLFGFKKAWKWSGHNDELRTIGLFFILIAALLYGGSDFANATEEKYREKIAHQDAVIEKLQSLLAACVTDNSAGKLLKIGESYYLCGISPLGSFEQKGR